MSDLAIRVEGLSKKYHIGGKRERYRTLRDILARAADELAHGREPSLPLIRHAAREGASPLARLETALHPVVAFVIMPLFALANAGVAVNVTRAGDPISLAVVAGLVIGKPVGVLLFSWAAVRLGVARMPTGVGWGMLLGGGCLAGIGFTMSIFIATLALDGSDLEAAKLGILGGSLVSGILGMSLLLRCLPRRPEVDA